MNGLGLRFGFSPIQRLAGTEKNSLQIEHKRGSAFQADLEQAEMFEAIGMYSQALKIYAGMAGHTGDSEVQYRTGLFYFLGYGDDPSTANASAVKYFQLAADQGHADAQNDLGCMYAEGWGVPADELGAILGAIRYFERSAAQGHPAGQYNLGRMYSEGLGVKRDLALAVCWIKQSAAQEYPLAQVSLGLLYDSGRADGKDGVPNPDMAQMFFKAAAEQNSPDVITLRERAQQHEKDLNRLKNKARNDMASSNSSTSGLGHLSQLAPTTARSQQVVKAKKLNPEEQFQKGKKYYLGQGVKKNDEIAAGYFLLSAEQGNAHAQSMLGFMYGYGLGVEQNDQQALKYAKLSAAQKHPEGQYHLACMYYAGFDGEKDIPAAIDYFRQSSELGHGMASYCLGVLFETRKLPIEFSFGIEQDDEALPSDYQQAFIYYVLSAEQGCSRAQEAIGDLHRLLGRNQDYQETLLGLSKYFNELVKKTDHPSPCTSYNLGIVYTVLGEYLLAFESFSCSAMQGHDRAQNALENLYEDASFKSPKMIQHAIEYFIPADQSNRYASFNLGLLFKQQWLSTNNELFYETSLNSFKKAEKLGHADAKNERAKLEQSKPSIWNSLRGSLEDFMGSIDS